MEVNVAVEGSQTKNGFRRHVQQFNIRRPRTPTSCRRSSTTISPSAKSSNVGHLRRATKPVQNHAHWVGNYPCLEHYRHVMARRPGHKIPSFYGRILTRPVDWARDLLNLFV